MGPLVLKGAKLIDGTGAPPLERGVVVVEGQKIVDIGAEGQVRVPEGAKTVEMPDCVLMPGLMDLHMHITVFEVADVGTRAGEKAAKFDYTPEAWMLYIAKRLRRTVEAGFTTVRDAGGAPTAIMAALRDGFNDGMLLGPRLVVPGLCITTNGHLYHFSKYLSKLPGPPVAANGPWEFRKLAREHFLAGADYLKTDASGGVGTTDEPILRRTLAREELEAIVDEAHALNKLVACHCHTPDAIRMAVAAGVDTIEHCALTDDDAIELLVSKKKLLVPTLTHRRTEGIETHRRAGSHHSVIEKMLRVQEIYYNSFRKLYKAGVRMACGTDTGFEPTAGSSAIELGLYVMLGMTPMEAIVTATRNAAEAIGRLNELGTLEAGKLADIVMVQGDPLDNIRILEDKNNVKLVLRGGNIVVDRRSD